METATGLNEPIHGWSDLIGSRLVPMPRNVRLVHFEGGEHGKSFDLARLRGERDAARRRARKPGPSVLEYLSGSLVSINRKERQR